MMGYLHHSIEAMSDSRVNKRSIVKVSSTHARKRFAELMELAVTDREIIEITRRGREPVALVAMSELRSLMETAHLLAHLRTRIACLLQWSRSGTGIAG